MEVLVDTSVWSIALRRNKSKASDEMILNNLSDLIRNSHVRIIGPIRQELLSGISENSQYQKLKKYLHPFEDLPINIENYDRAAEMFNHCRKNGVNGGQVDFLICSISEYYHLPIFTTDKDFLFYAKFLPIKLYSK